MKCLLTAMTAASAMLLPATAINAAPLALSKNNTKSTSSKAKASNRSNNRRSQATLANTNTAPASVKDTFQPTPNDCDLSKNQVVDVDDIMALLPLLGSDCTSKCDGDINRDSRIDVSDLMVMIANFGLAAPASNELADTALNGAILSLQNVYANDRDDLNRMGVANNAVCISSYGLLVDGLAEPGGLDRCLNHTAEEIKSYLTFYANHYNIALDTEDIVILDIEGYRFSPIFWGNYLDPSISYYNPERLDQILDAYMLRIKVARQVFPNAKLGLYDTITPHCFGDPDMGVMIRRQRGYEYAAARGIFEDIDYACPVLYQVWGHTDYGFSRSDAVTKMGIENTRALTRIDGTPLEIMPLMSLTIYNGDSNHALEPARVQDVSQQIDVLSSLGVNEYIIWNGLENVEHTDIPVYEQLQKLLDYREGAFVN